MIYYYNIYILKCNFSSFTRIYQMKYKLFKYCANNTNSDAL